MKRLLSILLSVLLLTAMPICGTAAAADTAADPARILDAAVLLDRVGAVVKTFDLGEQVSVDKEKDDFYVLKDGTLVEKWLVRLDSEKAPAERTVYIKARGETPLYDNPYLEGKPLREFPINTALTVLDEFGQLMLVAVSEDSPAEKAQDKAAAEPLVGYLLASNTKATLYEYNGWGSGGGSSGGGSSGGGGGAPVGVDGGDISLTAFHSFSQRASDSGLQPGLRTSPQLVLLASSEADTAGPAEAEAEKDTVVDAKGTILAQGAEGYACVFQRGDEVKVTEKGEEISTLLLDDDTKATVPTKLLFFKGDKPVEPWKGYAKANAPFYRSWRTWLETPARLTINTELQVLGNLDDFCIVQKADGLVGLVPANMISKTMIALYDFGGGGGSSGGGSSGGVEWTDPQL